MVTRIYLILRDRVAWCCVHDNCYELKVRVMLKEILIWSLLGFFIAFAILGWKGVV